MMTAETFKITLINPPQIFTKNQVGTGVTPPLGIAYLASYLLQHDHSVNIIDALGESPAQTVPFKKGALLRGLTFEQIIEKIDPTTNLIGISNLFSFAYPAVEELAKVIKKNFPNMEIILGGPHPSAMYDEILKDSPEVDYVAIGEGEESLLRLVMHLKGQLEYSGLTGLALRDDLGVPVKLTSTKRMMELESNVVPFPSRQLLPMENYMAAQESHGSANSRWTSILSSRGCPYGCNFCSSRKTRWISRDAKDVVDEIEHCIKEWGVKVFHFEDDNMTINRKRLEEICDEIITRNLNIIWQTPNGIRASRTNTDMLRKMRDSGCEHITLAPESGSVRVLKEIIQKGNDFDLEQLKNCGVEAKKLGMKVAAYFIIGLPGETKEDIEETIRYSKQLAKAGIDEVAFGLFIPLPGTPLFQTSRDKLDGLDWLDLLTIGDLAKAVSFNDEVSSDELNRLRRKAYMTFFITRMIYHPFAFLRSFFNVFRDIEETKTERSIRNILERYKIKSKKYKEKWHTIEEKEKDPVTISYPYSAQSTMKILMNNSPQYAYKSSLLKTIRLVAKETKSYIKSAFKK